MDLLTLDASGSTDHAYPELAKLLLGPGLLGLLFAAIAGSVMSTFNSGLNSAATVFTLDLYAVHWNPSLSEAQAVRVGRWTTAILAVLACLWVPVIQGFDGVFQYIQELWGFVSAPTLAVFAVGMLFKRIPPLAARLALTVGPLLYGVFRLPTWIWNAEHEVEALHAEGGLLSHWLRFGSLHFLHHMAILFALIVAMMLLVGRLRPLAHPVDIPRDSRCVDLTPWPHLKLVGGLLILAVLAIYIVWW